MQQTSDGLLVTGLKVSRGREFSLALEELRVTRGRLFALIGPSGVGKTTLLRAVAGLLPIDAGVVKIAELGELPRGELDSDPMCVWRRKVHVVGQGQALLPYLTVRENILALTRDYGVSARNPAFVDRVAQTAARFEIGALMHRYPSELSGGQYARALLARSLVHRPRALLMDEVSASIDPPLAFDILTRAKEDVRASNCLSIFVTHYVGLARQVADGIIFLSGPRTAKIYTPDAFIETSEPAVARFLLKR
jgi:ABC-type sugar transport system ATPase subunit